MRSVDFVGHTKPADLTPSALSLASTEVLLVLLPHMSTVCAQRELCDQEDAREVLADLVRPMEFDANPIHHHPALVVSWAVVAAGGWPANFPTDWPDGLPAVLLERNDVQYLVWT